MIEIYKKCEKSIDNKYGIEKIDNLDELRKPFLMCLSSTEDDNSVFGLIKEGARAARVRTTDEYAGGFKIDEMPVNFLGVKMSNQGFESLFDVIYKLLMYTSKENGASRNARRMNFFTYCNATRVYVNLEKRLREQLSSEGYKEYEIKEILSQISLVSLASKVDTSGLYATNVSFKDVHDMEVYDKNSRIAESKMEPMGILTLLSKAKTDGNSLLYFFDGKGSHDLKSFFDEDNIVKSSLCACVSKFIESSIINESSMVFNPIHINKTLAYVRDYNSEFGNMNELLEKLDNDLHYTQGFYKDVTKYTKEEDEELRIEEENYKQKNGLTLGR